MRELKLRRVRLAGHVAHMRETRNAHKILVREPEGRDQSEDIGVDRGVILE
jgi:hypothetical protein